MFVEITTLFDRKCDLCLNYCKTAMHGLLQSRRVKKIADKMDFTVETVRTYVRRIYSKLHVRNRKEAA